MSSICDPRDKSTYIYNDQLSYYKGYQVTYFGVTKRKADWDSLRHYEILANGCVSHFLDLKDCPFRLHTRFPKFEIAKGNMLAEHSIKLGKIVNVDIYHELVEQLLKYTRQYLSTTAMAKYVIETVLREHKG